MRSSDNEENELKTQIPAPITQFQASALIRRSKRTIKILIRFDDEYVATIVIILIFIKTF